MTFFPPICMPFVCVCVSNVFNRSEEYKQVLDQNHILYKLIPAGCTGELQPLDTLLNKIFKDELNDSFNSWYSSQVSRALCNNTVPKAVDLRMSVVKPLHANWLIKAAKAMSDKKDLIRRAWLKASIPHYAPSSLELPWIELSEDDSSDDDPDNDSNGGSDGGSDDGSDDSSDDGSTDGSDDDGSVNSYDNSSNNGSNNGFNDGSNDVLQLHPRSQNIDSIRHLKSSL
eukprot:TRINITY_DN5038_c0_g1_i2.p2 TRINITY_DN5038_c0_g1~~TRINITY_DN5038_c0_g1_i2.p2  ORF type:complete len:228 (-),score=31.34 TRINITY_DN5038_c0_g1_i2:144-827(-)